MTRTVRFAALAVLSLFTVDAWAQLKPTPAAAPAAAAGDAVVQAALAKALPNIVVDSIKPAPMAGFREVAIGGNVVYVSNDGRYLFEGKVVDLPTRNNLTDASEAVIRRGVLSGVGADRRIVFSPPNPKYRVTVFTDIDCAYCRKLHSQIADYNKLGIAVEYLFFPRAGLNSDSFNKAVTVWCSADRRQALTDAKLDKPIGKKSCTNPVSLEYDLGRKIGLDGTPAIYAADGSQIGGYLSPQDMLARLDRKAKPAGK